MMRRNCASGTRPLHFTGVSAMTISFACPECAKKYKVEDKFGGKKIKCRECNAVMPIPEAEPLVEAVDEWEEPAKPQKPSRKPVPKPEEDDDDGFGQPLEEAPRRTLKAAPAVSRPRSSRSDDDEAPPKKKARKSSSSSSGGPSVVAYTGAGLVGGLIGAVIWAVITVASGYEIGWIAWGLGGIVGFCVRAASSDHHDGSTPGMVAAGLSILSICLGKFLAAIFLVRKALGVMGVPPGVAVLDLQIAVFKSSFGAYDILFFFLAVATAYRLGSGNSEE